MSKITTVEVEMVAFMNGAIRPVDVPMDEFLAEDEAGQLELVFKYGQNDFQPKQFCSVSVGDVVRLNGRRFRVGGMGWETV
jgi:hypothetical protein